MNTGNDYSNLFTRVLVEKILISFSSVKCWNFLFSFSVLVTELTKYSSRLTKFIYRLIGAPPGINKYRPRREDDVFSWDLISRSIFSDKNLNPRRKIESHLKEGLDDVIREVSILSLI